VAMDSNEKQSKLSQIIQNYIGSYPADKSCSTWNEMESKMEEEINALFAAPSTVESPFSKEELVTIISDSGYLISNSMNNNELRKSVIAKANHLLTNANEFPCLMEVYFKSNNIWEPHMVDGMYKGQFMIKNDFEKFIGFQEARPIEPKPKELKDLKEDDSVYVICNHEVLPFGSKHKVIRHFELGLVVKAKDGYFIKSTAEKILSPYPPTHSQITAAEEAAINEVKARFDKMKREVGNG
jgi:hypothetical protein